jgi:hypothetical protein
MRPLYRAVNMLPDEEDVAVFLTLLGHVAGRRDWRPPAPGPGVGQATHVGQDTVLAEDWLAVLRV